MQRNLYWTATRTFHPRAGDVIHPVLWLVKGRAIARLPSAYIVAIPNAPYRIPNINLHPWADSLFSGQWTNPNETVVFKITSKTERTRDHAYLADY